MNKHSIIGCPWYIFSISLTLMIILVLSFLIRLARPRLPVLGINVPSISLSLQRTVRVEFCTAYSTIILSKINTYDTDDKSKAVQQIISYSHNIIVLPKLLMNGVCVNNLHFIKRLFYDNLLPNRISEINMKLLEILV